MNNISNQLGLNAIEILMLEKVSEVMRQFKGQTRQFGVNLTHSHFDVPITHVLHETNNKDNKTLVIYTVEKNKLPTEAYPTSWSFSSTGDIKVEMFCCDGGELGTSGGPDEEDDEEDEKN